MILEGRRQESPSGHSDGFIQYMQAVQPSANLLSRIQLIIMRVLIAALAIALVLACGSAVAMPLAEFSSSTLHTQLGKNAITKVYLSNPNSTFANITVWLGGDYPPGLVKFSGEEGLYLTPDQRNLTVGLNPEEERTVTLVVMSTGPNDTGYTITVSANTTADALLTDSVTMTVFIDYSPNFPGLESWAVLAIIAGSCLVYGRLCA